MEYFGLTDKGPIRAENQDSFDFSDNGAFLLALVCDGMGGENGGKTASEIATREIPDYFTKESSKFIREGDKTSLSLAIPVILKKSVNHANSLIYGKSLADTHLHGMGTTCVCCIFFNETIYCINVGDSRLYRFSEGNLDKITKDHSYNEYLRESGKIKSGDNYGHNFLTRALGSEESVNADLYILPSDKGDIYLLCSDGVYNALGDGLCGLINANRNESAEQITKIIISEAGRMQSDDNITALIIKP